MNIQERFDKSTTEEKIRAISNEVEEWEIKPTRRGQFVCSIDTMQDQGPGYIFRAKLSRDNKKEKWYQLGASKEIETLIKIAIQKLVNGGYINPIKKSEELLPK